MKMKRVFPVAKPEPNNGKKLTQLIQTRTPIEALKMLRAGQPIDVMLGYYVERGEADQDVYRMDKLDKLHLLEELKAKQKAIQEDVIEKINIANQFKKQQDEQKQASEDKTSSPPAAGGASPQGKNETTDK